MKGLYDENRSSHSFWLRVLPDWITFQREATLLWEDIFIIAFIPFLLWK